MSAQPPIDIARGPAESPQAYAAKVAYITMGASRSIDKVSVQMGGKRGSRSSRMHEWSSQHGWVAAAEVYDQVMAQRAAAEAAEAYMANLAEYRQRYGQAGTKMHKVGTILMDRCIAILEAPPVKDKEGNEVVAMPMNAATLKTAIATILAGADLEALGLQLEDLLPRLSPKPGAEQ